MELPGLDLAQGLRLSGGDAARYVRMLRLFAQQQAGTLGRVREALAAADTSEAQRQAHTLKGSAAQIAAPDLVTLAASLEQQLQQADAVLTPALAAGIDRDEQALQRLCRGLLQALGPAAPARDDAARDVRGLLQELEDLLREDDARAARFCEHHQAALSASLTPADFLALRRALVAYDFDQAQQLLQALLSPTAEG